MDLEELNSLFKLVVALGVAVSVAIAPVKKTVGGVICLVVTSFILLFGLYVYSYPDFKMTVFGVGVPEMVFLLFVAVLYVFDTAMIAKGRNATLQAKQVESVIDEKPSDWTPIGIKAEHASMVRRTSWTIFLDAEEASFRDLYGSVKIRVPRREAKSVISFGGLLHGANIVVKGTGSTERFLLSEIDLALFRKWL